MPIYSLDDFDFEKIARKEPIARVRVRILILAHLKDGHNKTEVARRLKVSQQTVRLQYQRFQAEGIEGLYDKPRSGCPFKLPPNQHDSFKQRILSKQAQRQGKPLRGREIRLLLKEEFQCHYSLNGVYDLLKTLDIKTS